MDTSEAEAVVLAILVERLGGRVTMTETDIHAMRDSAMVLHAHRNMLAFEWTLTLVEQPNLTAEVFVAPIDGGDWQHVGTAENLRITTDTPAGG